VKVTPTPTMLSTVIELPQGVDQLVADGEAETAATGVAGAGPVGAPETVEHVGRCSGALWQQQSGGFLGVPV
jgi:hypothetical protein